MRILEVGVGVAAQGSASMILPRRMSSKAKDSSKVTSGFMSAAMNSPWAIRDR
jgi:hypothetical protein